MTSFSSSSLPGLSSPQTSRYVARTESTVKATPRSPRTSSSPRQHLRHTSSQSGSKLRVLDLDEEPCLSHRESRKCLKCQRDRHAPTPGLSPIQSGRNISSSRQKVRTRVHESGSPCSSYNEAPQVDSEGRLQMARSQAHQRPNQLLFEAKHTNRRLASGKQVQVAALASPESPVYPLPPLSVPSTPPQHLRVFRHRPHQGSISSFTSASPSPLSRRLLPLASGYSTPSPSTRSRKSRSIRCVPGSHLLFFSYPLLWGHSRAFVL